MKKIAFVIPWYGENISGGAETALRGTVHHMFDAGIEVEVLTTCVKDFQSDWSENYYKPGIDFGAGFKVRRFPVRARNARSFDKVNAKLMQGQRITYSEEDVFLREMVNSTALYQYIGQHHSEYSLFVFIPYMFGTTYYGIRECREKAVMIPCLHDEAYAYLESFRKEFKKVRGMIFLSSPEEKLARKLYGVNGKQFVSLGTGVDTDFCFDEDRFRDKYHIESPFVLYAGRKESGKKVDELIRYFVEYKRRRPSDLKLVLLGGGDIEIPSDEIIDLGFVSAQDKYDAYAAASVFCNPSQFESFSIVIMESWIAGRPVLVNGKCAVTKDFVIKASGGLYYESFDEFAGCMDYLLKHNETAKQMGKNGRAFVQENFSWPQIVQKYMNYFKMIVGVDDE